MATSQSQGYFATPSAGSGPGILVLHAWWGLNDFFRGFCDRLAKQGFVVMAPDMFAGKLARTVEEAQQHQSDWDEAQVVPPIILPAIESLRKHPAVTGNRLGVVGFSMGGYWSLWLAQKMPALVGAVTLFYGTNGGGGNFHASQAAYLGHFAERDPYESAGVIRSLEKKLRDAGRPVAFHTYPETGHWFFEQDRPEAYNAQAAQLAWERTLAFLKRALAPS